MISDLRRWNADRVKADKMPVGMGVGVNTDNVVTGNIGSSKRMDFTMIGDGVNLAARLEGSCKTYGAQIIISEFMQNNLKGILVNINSPGGTVVGSQQIYEKLKKLGKKRNFTFITSYIYYFV